MEDKPAFLEESQNLEVTRIEHLGDIVRLHWVDEHGNTGYTDMTLATFNEQIDNARKKEVLKLQYQPKSYVEF